MMVMMMVMMMTIVMIMMVVMMMMMMKVLSSGSPSKHCLCASTFTLRPKLQAKNFKPKSQARNPEIPGMQTWPRRP